MRENPTNTPIGYIYYRQHNKQLVVMVFTTCFDLHESSSGYVQNLLVFALLLQFWRLLVGMKLWLSLH
jgi:hypothetical protein